MAAVLPIIKFQEGQFIITEKCFKNVWLAGDVKRGIQIKNEPSTERYRRELEAGEYMCNDIVFGWCTNEIEIRGLKIEWYTNFGYEYRDEKHYVSVMYKETLVNKYLDVHTSERYVRILNRIVKDEVAYLLEIYEKRCLAYEEKIREIQNKKATAEH